MRLAHVVLLPLCGLAFFLVSVSCVIIATSAAGDPHGYAYDLTHGRVCHALYGRGCKADPND